MKEISLTQNKTALVDDEDYEDLVKYNWSAHYHHPSGNWYVTRFTREDGTISMHRQILDYPKSNVDHVNGNGLDNQRSNLRLANHSQNGANRKKGRNETSSRFKGVHWYSAAGKWKVMIYPKGEAIFLGTFDDEIEAAKRYDEAALKYFGEYARLNFDR